MKSDEEKVAGDIDLAVFGSNNPTVIEARFRQAYEQQQAREATFGGYLRALRRRRELTIIAISNMAKVPAMLWSRWEGDESLPEPGLLDQVIERLSFGSTKREKLFELLGQARRHTVEELSFLCFEKLAAKGTQSLDVHGEWEAFSAEVQSLLLAWGERRRLKVPEQLFDRVAQLRHDEERAAWIRQVLGDHETP